MHPIGVLLGIIVVIFLVANGPQMLKEARSATTEAITSIDQKAGATTSHVAASVDEQVAAVDAKAKELSARIDAKVREADAAVSKAADDLAAKKARAEADLVDKARAAIPAIPGRP